MASLAAGDLFNVNGQVIVITGAGTGMMLIRYCSIRAQTDHFQGLGAMMARALAKNGAHRVFILGRRLEKLQEVAKEGVCSRPTFRPASAPNRSCLGQGQHCSDPV